MEEIGFQSSAVANGLYGRDEITVLLGRNQKLHCLFAGLSALLVLGGAGWYALSSHWAGRWVGGSSPAGLVLGTIAALIIGFELLLWPRKRLRRKKLGPTRFWLAAHLWFGLATGPLAFIHAGYRFGGAFSSVLMWLLLFVLASGLYGWVMQIVIPRWMLGNLPSETITAQINDVLIQNSLDARRMLTVAYGPKPEGLTKLTNLNEQSLSYKGSRTSRDFATGEYQQIVVGAVQRRGPQRGRSTVESVQEVDAADARVVWNEFAAVVEPFLLGGIPNLLIPTSKTEKDKLRTRQKTIEYFGLLRESSSMSSSSILDRLEELCEKRHQFDAQRKAQAWLHSWIAVHASASIILGVLLLTHIFLAIRYM